MFNRIGIISDGPLGAVHVWVWHKQRTLCGEKHGDRWSVPALMRRDMFSELENRCTQCASVLGGK